MIFSKRLAFAKKYGFDLTAEFNALVCDVEKTEREECAKLCDEPLGMDEAMRHRYWWECAEAIRARDFI